MVRNTDIRNVNKVATFHSPFKEKFGIPRQAGVVSQLLGCIVLEKEYRTPDAIRGMEDFDYLWLIWGFSGNRHKAQGVTVRPPRLGGNKQLGVFATRSPFRPNPLGLSSVRIDHIDYDCAEAPVIYVTGADLMDGTPIYDIKPYIPYTDAHPDARGGFTDSNEWQPLEVVIPDDIAEKLSKDSQSVSNAAEARSTHLQHASSTDTLSVLCEVLKQDPRPHYHNDPDRIYGMQYDDMDVRFKVSGNVLTVVEVKK